jgi:hypothetical protein
MLGPGNLHPLEEDEGSLKSLQYRKQQVLSQPRLIWETWAQEHPLSHLCGKTDCTDELNYECLGPGTSILFSEESAIQKAASIVSAAANSEDLGPRTSTQPPL